MLVTVHVATLAVMRACSFQLSELVRQNRDFLVSEQSVINANLVEKFAEKWSNNQENKFGLTHNNEQAATVSED